MLVIIFLHAAWSLVDHLLKMLAVGDHGVGNVARNSVPHTMILDLASAYQLLKIITDNVVKLKKASQKIIIVLADIIRTVIRDGKW